MSCIISSFLRFQLDMHLKKSGVALFTVKFSGLHYNIFERGCEAASDKKCKIARNCLTSTFKNIVKQMRKGNHEKGYYINHKCDETKFFLPQNKGLKKILKIHLKASHIPKGYYFESMCKLGIF